MLLTGYVVCKSLSLDSLDALREINDIWLTKKFQFFAKDFFVLKV